MKLLSILILILGLNNGGLDKQIEKYLDARLKAYDKYEYQLMKAPGKSVKIKIDNEKDFNISGSIGYIPVKIYEASHRESRSYLTVRLKLIKNVLVAKREVEYAKDLAPSMFENKLMNVAKVRGTLFTRMDKVNDYRSTRRLKAGTILTEEQLEKIPDVVAGDKLNAFSNAGAVSVSTKAFAREDGNIGENIKIRTIDNKMFVAKIIDFNKVIILE